MFNRDEGALKQGCKYIRTLWTLQWLHGLRGFSLLTLQLYAQDTYIKQRKRELIKILCAQFTTARTTKEIISRHKAEINKNEYVCCGVCGTEQKEHRFYERFIAAFMARNSFHTALLAAPHDG
jgi:hypothetical protein